MDKDLQATLAKLTGDAAAVLAAVIEMAMSDAYFQDIIAKMQAEGRQVLTDDEKAGIKSYLDQHEKDAQQAIDALRTPEH